MKHLFGKKLLQLSELLFGVGWYFSRSSAAYLMAIYPGKEGRKQVKQYYEKKLQMICLTSICVGIFFFMVLAKNYLEEHASVSEITRNDYKESSRSLSLSAEMDGETYELEIDVAARELTDEEKYSFLKQAELEITKIMLGENQSLQHVDQTLNLVTEIPDNPVQVRWYSSNYQLIGSDGIIYAETFLEEGEEVTLYAELTLEDISKEIPITVVLFEKDRSATEETEYSILESVKKANEKQSQKKTFSLPTHIRGKTVHWYRTTQTKPVAILLFGMLVVILLSLAQNSRLKQRMEYRTTQLEADYAEVLNKFVLLLGAGMTISAAWVRIVKDYETYRKEQHFVYEEMKLTRTEIENGVSEIAAYERFGKRLASPQYSKFAALLIQNLRKGNKELLALFRAEASDAFQKRKNAAQRKGEEVGTKLLAPMFLMLCAVLMIVMIPAFLSMQM